MQISLFLIPDSLEWNCGLQIVMHSASHVTNYHFLV